MTQQPAEIQVKDIDHLGIVAGIIDQMGWVDAINELVGVHSLEQVSTGQVLKWTFDGLCVADSALYSADNLIAMKQLKWLTRVPLTLAAAKQILLEIQTGEWINSSRKGYRMAERRSDYGGIQQRWLIVQSEQRQQADIQQLNKRIAREHKQQLGKLRQLSTQAFACEPDARAAAVKFEQSLKYHRLCDLKCIPQSHYDKAGRPRLDEAPSRITYCLQATLAPNSEVIEVEMTRAGRFILATNVLDANQLSADDALTEYKDQQSNERGFRFLKDPLFFTSSVFVKSPKRMEALVMVMGLCLLVYSLAQRQLRQALAQAGEGINNQVGKLTERPTLRWVFQSFQSVHLVIVDGTKQITNLTAQRQKVLRFLGTEAMRYYQLC